MAPVMYIIGSKFRYLTYILFISYTVIALDIKQAKGVSL